MLRNPEGKLFFLDTEFTDLSKEAELISIALCTEDGKEMYLELDFDPKKTSAWVKENVLPGLRSSYRLSKGRARDRLIQWLNYAREERRVIIVSDLYAYDWVLFCDLFDNKLPDFIYYIPLDLSTMLWMRGIDPDIFREGFAGIVTSGGRKHTADWDARVIQACFKKLMKIEEPPVCLINPPLDEAPLHPCEGGSCQGCEQPEDSPLEEIWRGAWKKVNYALANNFIPQPSALDGLSDKIALLALDGIVSHMAEWIAGWAEEKILNFSVPDHEEA